MRDALFGLILVGALVFGYYVMGSFDHFMDQIYKKTFHRK